MTTNTALDESTQNATTNKCCNAEPGTFNHECGKPATWIGIKPSGFRAAFCDFCKDHGWEATGFTSWERLKQ